MNNNFISKNSAMKGSAWQPYTEDKNRSYMSYLDTDASAHRISNANRFAKYQHLENGNFDNGSIWGPVKEAVMQDSVTSYRRDITRNQEYNNRNMDDSNNFTTGIYSRRVNYNDKEYNNKNKEDFTSTFSKFSSPPICNNEYNNRNMENNSNRRIFTDNSNDWLDSNSNSRQALRNNVYNINVDNLIDKTVRENSCHRSDLPYITEHNSNVEHLVDRRAYNNQNINDYQIHQNRIVMKDPIERWGIDDSNRRINNQSPNKNEYNNRNIKNLSGLEREMYDPSDCWTSGFKFYAVDKDTPPIRENDTRFIGDLRTRDTTVLNSRENNDRILDDLINIRVDDTTRRLRENERQMDILFRKMENYKSVNARQSEKKNYREDDYKTIIKDTAHQTRNMDGNRKSSTRKANTIRSYKSVKKSLRQSIDKYKEQNKLSQKMHRQLHKNLWDHITDNLRVSIVNRDSDCKITYPQFKIVLDNLHKNIIRHTLKRKQICQLAFFSPELDKGKIRITCVNNASLAWLKSNVDNFGKLWPDADLKVVAKVEYRKGSIVLPDMNYIYKDVFKRIELQNKNINTILWKFTGKRITDKGILYELSVDLESLKAMEATDYQLCYNNKNIKFNLLSRTPQRERAGS